jgi:hypothetical protein
MRSACIPIKSTVYALDRGAIGSGRELSVDKDACRKVELALERLGVKLVSKGGCSHSWGLRELGWRAHDREGSAI